MTSWRLILRRRWVTRRRAEDARRTKAVVRALMDAADAADASAIAALLGKGATLTVDAGAHAAGLSTSPVSGPTATAVRLLSVLDDFPDRTLTLHDINGDAGILIRSDGRVAGVIAVEVRAHAIAHVWAIVNPDKLAHWNRT